MLRGVAWGGGHGSFGRCGEAVVRGCLSKSPHGGRDWLTTSPCVAARPPARGMVRRTVCRCTRCSALTGSVGGRRLRLEKSHVASKSLGLSSLANRSKYRAAIVPSIPRRASIASHCFARRAGPSRRAMGCQARRATRSPWQEQGGKITTGRDDVRSASYCCCADD